VATADVRSVVVVGAGLAGARTVEALRLAGYAGSLTLIGAELHEPYDRPPLSKELLTGEMEHSTLTVDWAALDVERRFGSRALGVGNGAVETTDGPVPYDRLVVATGAGPVRLPGDSSALVLRTVEDARELRSRLKPGTRLLIVGAGWIGAEVATAARAAGCAVTVVEALGTPLAAVFPAAIGTAMGQWYADAGVDLLCGTAVSAVDAGGVELADGRSLPGEGVLRAVGVRPEVAWLEGSGIEVGPGVVVDEHLRSVSDERVYAVGDAAAWWSRRYGVRLCVEHWDDALRGPDVVAANVMGGSEVHDPVPYFWSTQLGRRVQMVGHPPAGDRMVWRGSPDDEIWGVGWLRGERLVAMLTVNRPRDTIQARKLIEHETPVDEARLADVDVAIRDATR
jgi:NADPH-dependent 2,4-dienoyl-CoA reductase/sulfur reductase-like enzyme